MEQDSNSKKWIRVHVPETVHTKAKTNAARAGKSLQDWIINLIKKTK